MSTETAPGQGDEVAAISFDELGELDAPGRNGRAGISGSTRGRWDRRGTAWAGFGIDRAKQRGRQEEHGHDAADPRPPRPGMDVFHQEGGRR